MRLLLHCALERRQERGPHRGADFEHDDRFSEREKAALRYADAFKRGEHAIDRDDVYAELQRHFSDEEIIELGLLCAQTDGVGKFINP